MSTATAVDATPAPVKGSKKKLVIIIVAATLLLALAGGAAVLLLKKKSGHDTEGDGETASESAKPAKAAKHEDKGTPTFVPLDQFTVNLADRDAERYAQVAVTLEFDDAKMADKVKTYMPAIRNNVLLAIADKTAAQLMDRDGKQRLADEIRRETARALGYDAEGDRGASGKARKTGGKDDDLPVRAVHFSNIIIQ